ncbi:hypothetical protein MASR2M8_08220 [Opitutaceae bacterium]
MRRAVLIISGLGLVSGFVMAQMRANWPAWAGGRGQSRLERAQTARDVPSDSTGTPMWENPADFSRDVFTFTRIRYSNGGVGYGGRRRGGGWSTDLPDSDLNLSYRVQQMTSIRVDPNGRIIRLTDPELRDFPFIYMAEPGSIALDEAETEALRDYLLNGGFLMLDDFWGDAAWDHVAYTFKDVFPDRDFIELPLDHPLYHGVFDIKAKGQVPNVGLGVASQNHGITWELPDAQEVHHRAILDDKGRIIVLATHNTDNGDGWEREGESDYYFHNFSEKIAYPLGINIIFYIMTHE